MIASAIASSSTWTMSSSSSSRIDIVSSPGCFTSDPVRDRAAVGLARLHADDPDARPQRAQHGRDPGSQAAAADRQQERRRRRGSCVDELEPDRPLAGDHERVLERVHERRAGLGARARSPPRARRRSIAPASTVSAP